MSYLKKFVDSSKELSKVQTIAVRAMMLALRVVLGMFANITLAFIPLPVVKIGFTFIPMMITAYLYGPVCAGVVAAMGDILSYLLAPTALGFNPAITLCYLLEGILYGLCLYKTELSLKNLIAAKAFDLALCTLTLHSYVLWVLFFSSSPFWLVLAYRAAVLVPCAALEIAVMLAIRKPLIQVQKKFIR